MIPYHYVTLRVVPRVDREEFLNGGIVLFADALGYLDAAFHVAANRLGARDTHLNLAAFKSSLPVR